MSEITNGMSITRDQSQYVLGGGKMKRSSIGTPLKCSLNSMDLENFVDDDCVNATKKKFNWENIKSAYKNCDNNLIDLNLYTFCVDWKSIPRPPQFFGFNDQATWPLKEDYAKWMIALFKPWKNSLEELKGEDGTYKSTLEFFMYSKKFPSQKRAAILRAKRNDSFVDTSVGGYLNDNEFTPTTDRRNEELENAVENACSAPSVDNVDAFEDININLFNRLESRIPE